jgi:hypothetical protein
MALTPLLYTMRDDTFFRVCWRFGVTPIGTVSHPAAVAGAAAQLGRKHVTVRLVLEELTDVELVLAQRILFSGDQKAWNSPGSLTRQDRREVIEMIVQRAEPAGAQRRQGA